MARVYLRIIAALFALAVLALTVMGAYYAYREAYMPEVAKTRQVRDLLKVTAPKADPGKKRFEVAMELVRRGEFDASRDVLTELLDVYRDSERGPDARRVLGEMNLDRLFSRAPMPGKLEYTALKGDSLGEIAKKFRTTIAYIKRVNNMLGAVIHPEDRIIVYPLDFSLDVDLDKRVITLLRDGKYVKDYPVAGLHLPYPSLPRDTTVGDKPAWVDGKKIQPTDDRYTGAKKWLQTAGRSGRPGVVFCEPPRAVPVTEGAVAEPATPGIYLEPAQLEELCTLVRVGSPLRFLKAPAAAPARG